MALLRDNCDVMVVTSDIEHAIDRHSISGRRCRVQETAFVDKGVQYEMLKTPPIYRVVSLTHWDSVRKAPSLPQCVAHETFQWVPQPPFAGP